jgi:hypothetical protein
VARSFMGIIPEWFRECVWGWGCLDCWRVGFAQLKLSVFFLKKNWQDSTFHGSQDGVVAYFYNVMSYNLYVLPLHRKS